MECVSCGLEANPTSERNFCDSCDAIFQAGLQNQSKVEERAQRLETAKTSGDTDAVGQIMTEIFIESAVANPVTTIEINNDASVEKVDK